MRHAHDGGVYRTVLGRRAFWKVQPYALIAVALALPSGFEVFRLIAATVLVGWVVWLFAGTTYRIRGGTLTVAAPFRSRRIALDEIVYVKRHSDASFGGTGWDIGDYALGTDVVEIRYDVGSCVIVSPRDEAGFLAELGVHVEGAKGGPLQE